MKKVWHPYQVWEDYISGMWRKCSKSDEESLLAQAIDFTGNASLYGSYMLRVIKEWPLTCEHNLTDKHQNRRAWLGHAACSMAINCPEYLTRMAWGHLTAQQQSEADAQADSAIKQWEIGYKNKDS